MAWETRGGNGPYYTSSHRVHGKIVRTYHGTGPLAQLIAKAEEIRRLTTEADHRRVLAEWQEEQDALKPLDEAVDGFLAGVETVHREHLEAAGYHQHARGEWRRKRREKENHGP